MSHGLRVTFSVGAVAQRGSSFAGSSSLVAAPQQAGGSGVRSVTCMAKKGKDVRLMITLECTEQKATGVGGISRYTSEKNRRNTPGRLELMKYNRYLRKHTLHREIKK